VYAFPAGTLPSELDGSLEDLLMPDFRQRILAAYLADMPNDGSLPS
jgi:hypothetical protein